MTKPVPLVLKVNDWPTADQRAWYALFDAEDIFSDEGPCMSWSEGSRRKRAQSYGQWLSFLKRCAPDALDEPAGARLNETRAQGFLAECDLRLSPRSSFGLFSDLHELFQHLAPERDWQWLKAVVKRLRLKSEAGSLPEAPNVTAQEIWAWSLRQLRDVSHDEQLSAHRRAIRFRQALMIGFMIARPYRRRTLLAMTIDDHLRRQGQGFTLHFSAADMKDKRARTASVPTELAPAMHQYLDQHRPELLASKLSNCLWINQYGDAITPDGFSRELPKVTERAFGVALRPHAFRIVAATSIAETDPEHVGIIRDILGHATLDMSQKHYNRAKGITSCGDYQDLVGRILEDRPTPHTPKRRLTAGRTKH